MTRGRDKGTGGTKGRDKGTGGTKGRDKATAWRNQTQGQSNSTSAPNRFDTRQANKERKKIAA